ncbi:hypothetical protein BP6252_01778 [Coleophoma cylindrospora]|uniref:Rhodopsin domain-containing protein n=1 Tax=Coleophoma cylindrospora TaxID=1849047 RepID=A0A3D8STX7_9HELO|nr:hypothetical protein BP6252_01778 [Coleophoma cylindrospora]
MTVPVRDKGPAVLGVAGLFLTLSTIAIILRTYCRIVVVRNFGYDDYFAVIAWVFFVFFCTFAITGVHHGTGQHASALPPAEIPVGLKWWWACEPVYVLANMSLKLSIGIFLLRIAVARTHRLIIYTVIVVSEVYGAAYFLLFCLQCIPSKYFWTQYTGGSGSCMNTKIIIDATYVYSAISCWADWTLGVIPVFLVWNLQMNSRTKLSVGCILAVGAVASTATIIRIPYVKNLGDVADFLYATTGVAIWSTSETGIGITASCVATLRPLFRTFFMRTAAGSSSQGPSNVWPKSGGNSGYIRSKSNNAHSPFNDEIALRTDVGKVGGVTTVVGCDRDVELGEKKRSGGQRWNHSNGSSEGSHWEEGIMKTVESTQRTH